MEKWGRGDWQCGGSTTYAPPILFEYSPLNELLNKSTGTTGTAFLIFKDLRSLGIEDGE
jgi:hypothetical protein